MTGSGEGVASVITVTYESADFVSVALQAAIASVQFAGFEPEVIVVDNASQDSSIAAVRSVSLDATVLVNTENSGFGVANNQAFAKAAGRLWLLVNPDTILDTAAVSRLATTLESHADIAAVAPTLRDAPNAAESAGMHPSIRSAIGHFLFLNRIPWARGSWQGFQLRPVRGGPVEVEWASAAVLLLRPAAVEAVGGFDERIFLYGEDIDLCARMRAAGWRVILEPGAAARHAIGHERVSTLWVDGLHAAYARGAGRLPVIVFDAVIAAGLAIRAALGARRGSEPARPRLRRSAARALQLALATGIGRASSLVRGAAAAPPDEGRMS